MERRAWKRTPVDISVRYRPVEEAYYHEAYITDVHHEGCCLKGKDILPKGQELRFVFQLPMEGSLYFVGTVMWSQPVSGSSFFATGVRFLLNDPVTQANCNKLYSYGLKV